MSRRGINPFAVFSILLMVLTTLSPLLAHPADAGAGQGTIVGFSDGSTSVILEFAGGTSNSTAAVALERNTTITNAAFSIEYTTADATPGEVVLDIQSDGVYEWAWNAQGYGNLGEQKVFSNGLQSVTSGTNSSGTIVGEVLLPASAQVQFSEAMVEFSPDFGGGWVVTGAIDSLTMADFDGDNLPEPLFLQRGHTWPNSSISPAVGVLDWTAAAGFSTVTWTPICDGAALIEAADFNGDGYADVAGFDTTNSSACLLLSGTNGAWAANTNLSLGTGASGIATGDLDGDGDHELISVHGTGSLNEFAYNSTNGSMVLNSFTTVSANGTGLQATLGDVAVAKFWGGGNDTVVVTDNMDGHVTMWNASQGNWVMGAPGSAFDCMKSGLVPVDWNQDGLTDLLGNTDTGMCTATFNGSGWTTNVTNATQMNNYSVGDWNQNGTVDILLPIIGSTDGNDATFTGSLSSRPFGGNGSISSATRTVYPHTAPRDVVFADMDGDGVLEHIVHAGESSLGLYIAGWHNVSIDFDMDMNPEGELKGYAGDGQNGVDPLEWMDMGNISQSLGNTFSSQASQTDYYGTGITTLRVMARSTGGGDVTLSGLNLTYEASFIIDENPSAGNLSNLFNMLMLPGTGTFNITLPLNTTLASRLTLSNVIIEWVAGMANPVYKDAPLFQDDMVWWDSAENRHAVILWWDDTAMQDLDFLQYQLFRWENGSAPQLNSPFQMMIQDNFTFDVDNVSGKTWDYVVRGVYQNGIVSNFSTTRTVTVPPILPPDVIPPEAVADVSATDHPADEGGVIDVSWSASNSTDVLWYALYVSESPIGDVSGLSQVVNYTVYENLTNFTYLTVEDGVDHYFAVVCGDLAGNVNWTATSTGPVMSRNNSVRAVATSLSIESTHPEEAGEVIATAGHSLYINGTLVSEGEPLQAAYTLTITNTGAAPITIVGTSEVNGTFSNEWRDWLDFESSHTPLAGEVDVRLDFAGGTWGNDSQGLAAANTTSSFHAKTKAALSTSPSPLQLDENGAGIVTISLTAENAIEQVLLEGLSVDYHLGNETNQATSESGTLPLNATGAVEYAISYIIGGELDISLAIHPTWLNLSVETVRAIILPPPEVDGGEQNETVEETPELAPLNFSCEDDNWVVEENGTTLSKTCTVDNPNDVLVYMELATAAPAWLDLDVIPTSASIFSNSSKNIQISLAAPSGTPADNYSFDLSVVASAAGHNHSSNSTTIDFAVIAEEIDDVIDGGGGDDSQNSDDIEAQGQPMWLFAVAGIALLGVIAMAFLVVIRRISSDEEDGDDDEYDLYDDFYADEEEDVKPKRKGRPKVIHTPAKMREKKHEWAMDESGLPYKGEKPGARPSQRKRPRPVAKVVRAEPEWEEDDYDQGEEEYSGGEDYTQSDNYHIDDDGVEWWKDELGVWWYRYPDEEEWSEFIE